MSVTDTEKTQLVIFGSGGHAKSVISVALAQDVWQIVGLVTDFAVTDNKQVLGYPVLGGQEQLDDLYHQGVRHAFVAIGDDQARQRISDLLIESGFQLVNIIHPTAIVMPAVTLEDGILLHAYTLIGAETHLSRGCIVQPHVSVGHESHLGAYVQLCPGVRVGGQAEIGALSFIGPNAVIYPQIGIGNSVHIGANTTVNKSINDHQMVINKSPRDITRGRGDFDG